jgi:hypothetical protein
MGAGAGQEKLMESTHEQYVCGFCLKAYPGVEHLIITDDGSLCGGCWNKLMVAGEPWVSMTIGEVRKAARLEAGTWAPESLASA